jgi:hypothetical protein
MMKSISIFVALLALLFTDMVLAAGAVATSITGTVSVQSGSAAARPLRQGDTVVQGDTVITAVGSSAVLRFDDGEITALTGNSRMQVTAYQYNATNNSGNVFLSLLGGGMRAITGLIGRNQPNSVAYRAATATIGIRGTTVDVVTDGTSVAVSVGEGAISFTYNGQTVTVTPGNGAYATNGTITPGSATSIFNSISPDIQRAIGGIEALTAAINLSGGASGTSGETVVNSNTNTTSTITNSTSGGGGVSPH